MADSRSAVVDLCADPDPDLDDDESLSCPGAKMMATLPWEGGHFFNNSIIIFSGHGYEGR